MLIGDDDPAFRELLRGLLAGTAETVVEMPDADAVLAALSRTQPDLLVLDLRMPGGGGERVLTEIEHNQSWRDLAVVVVSSASSDLADLRARHPGLVTIDKAVLNHDSLAHAIAATDGTST